MLNKVKKMHILLRVIYIAFIVSGIFYVAIALSRCDDAPIDDRFVSVKIENIKMVLRNSRNSYTVCVQKNKQEPNTCEMQNIYLYALINEVTIISDVPESQNMYILYRTADNFGDTYSKDVEIHVHNIYDVKGGTWDQGKFGKTDVHTFY